MRPIYVIHCNAKKKIFTEYTKYDDKIIQLSCKADRDQTIAP